MPKCGAVYFGNDNNTFFLYLHCSARAMSGPAGDGNAGGNVNILFLCFTSLKCFLQNILPDLNPILTFNKLNVRIHFTAIREAGGAFGKIEVAREAEYFYKKVSHFIPLSIEKIYVDISTGFVFSQLYVNLSPFIISHYSNKSNWKSWKLTKSPKLTSINSKLKSMNRLWSATRMPSKILRNKFCCRRSCTLSFGVQHPNTNVFA